MKAVIWAIILMLNGDYNRWSCMVQHYLVNQNGPICRADKICKKMWNTGLFNVRLLVTCIASQIHVKLPVRA